MPARRHHPQQFGLSVGPNSDQPTVVAAPQFDADANAAGTVGRYPRNTSQQAGPSSPSTVVHEPVVAAFTFMVEGDAEEDTDSGSPAQAAITAPRISLVLVVHPTIFAVSLTSTSLSNGPDSPRDPV